MASSLTLGVFRGNLTASALLALSACGGSQESDGALQAGTRDGNAASVPADARFLKYIRSDQHTRLELEIDAVPGLEPSSGASAPVLGALGRALDKPGGISVRSDDAIEPRGAAFVWTMDELDSFAESTFADRSEDGSVAIHVLFVDGHYEKDGDQGTVLGVAWRHRHIAMFKDNIARACGSRGTLGVLDPAACQRAEAAIWLHEAGHVLGLVDNGLPMVNDHRDPDPEHGRHDVDPACIMYWAYDGDAAVDAVLSNLIGNREQLDFCPRDLEDIDAVK